MSAPARIVLPNGVGSVGKSAIAKALQSIASDWYLHVAMDSFLDMLPGRYFGDPDGMVFETIEDGGKPSILINTGPVVERALAGMRHAVAALAAEGNNLIVDDVYMAAEAAEYDRLLAPFRVHRVGMFAPLAVLEARGRARGDRAIGLARWQFEHLHRDMRYDLELDTSRATPLECAEQIKAVFGL